MLQNKDDSRAIRKQARPGSSRSARMGGAMDVLVLAVQLAAFVLILYGLGLCAWMAYSARPGERRFRPFRGQRNLRLISELHPQPANRPQDDEAGEVKKAA